MKEYISINPKEKIKVNKSDLNNALKDLLATQIKRLKVGENNIFLNNVGKYFDYLPTDFKDRLSIYFDNNLDQDSPLGQELYEELKNIIKNKDDKAVLADYEIIDD
jgi:hypothetical protein